MDEWVWLRHPETHGTFKCPADAAEAWRARGWVDIEPVGEPAAPTKDPEPETVREEPAPEPDRLAAVKPQATEPTTAKKPRGGTAASDAEER